jgi:hypothetical protein
MDCWPNGGERPPHSDSGLLLLLLLCDSGTAR